MAPSRSKRKKQTGGVDYSQFFVPSPSPEPDWDSDTEWNIKSVHDQTIDPGDPDTVYSKVEWADWKDDRGFSTTWERDDESQRAVRERFEQQRVVVVRRPERMRTGILRSYKPSNISYQYYRDELNDNEPVLPRRAQAGRANEHEVSPEAGEPVPAQPRPTTLTSRAALKRKFSRSPTPRLSSTDNDERERPAVRPRLDPVASSNSSRAGRDSDAGSSRTKVASASKSGGRAPLSQAKSFTSQSTTTTATAVPSSSGSTLLPRRSSSGISKTSARSAGRAQRLPQDWEDAIPDSAESITICNDVDDERLPHVPDGFQYLENMYLNEPEFDQLFVAGCNCTSRPGRGKSCSARSRCDCREDQDGAYVDGLYTFNGPAGQPIRECTDKCGCSIDECANRVASLPRSVPLQLFKTDDKLRGWGVRATASVPRGKVLGLYTGELVRRSKVQKFSAKARDYSFDLDFDDAGDGGTTRYSVVAYACGNWTRFLNHSCSPNLRVFPVYIDHPEIPKLAFAACKDISAYEELHIDYSNAKGIDPPPKLRRSDQECHCGSPNCRGFI